MSIALQAWVALRSLTVVARHRLEEEVGEGVISTAIAVLIMALIGALMWGAFQLIFNDAADRAGGAVREIS
ncbi:MAG TPA: hypothetical protein VMN58_09765 [Acidimicrobiales bacterium]|nr:hypothetical protein [Acidimicrobiales bacterium]